MGLWNSYKKLWTKPLAKLQEYDLIEYEGPAQNRVYRVRDEAIEPPVDDLGLNQHLAE